MNWFFHLSTIKYVFFIPLVAMKSSTYPKVSFIIPVLNEEKTIGNCLDSILSLKYPLDCIEILIARGPSSDNTNAVLEEYAHKYQQIVLLDNPTGNTAIGRNICIDASTGDMLMNYSGHVTAESNLLSVLAVKLREVSEDIVSVGCANISPKDQLFVGKTASVAFASFMGGKNMFVQNAEFAEERFMDHISFACYWKKPVVSVGGFDPAFWCGQDAELDLRLLKEGYKILYTPETKVYHYKRTTLKSLFRQMYRYGIARAKMAKKHPKTLKFFHLLGAGFLLGLLGIIVLTVFSFLPVWFLPGVLLLYVLVSFGSAALVKKDVKVILASPLFYFLIHSGYGAGFLRGLVYGKL